MGESTQQSEAEPAGETGTLSLEDALERLEATARRLEQGDLPLEEALALFESGVALTRRCTETLEAAERRIEILVADREAENGLRADPFEAEVEHDTLDEDDDGFDEV